MPLSEFTPLLTEMFVLAMACIILVLDAFLPDERRVVSYTLSQLTLLVAALISWSMLDNAAVVVMHGTFVSDPMAALLKTSIFLITFGAFMYSRSYLVARGIFKGEYYVLGLFAVLGMQVLVSAHSLLTLYLGLELLSLSLYAMVAFNRDSADASEAAMKYFVLGALASGLLLYGISMIYGATGKLDFQGVSAALASGTMDETVLVFGLVFVVIGIAFKFGAVPFHMWAPDVYDGASTPVTLLIGSLPKIAAFGLAMRILVEGMGPLAEHWSMMLVILSVLSMALGNIVAIAQDNIKRMLAYSTISHVGFIFLGILSGTEEGYKAAMFYAIVYSAMAAGGFGILVALDRKGAVVDQLYQLKGLNDRHPWLAATMLLIMFSMAGVPPTVGFWAKLFVLEAVVSIDMTWLAIVAVVFSIIGAFYYLRVVKFMYFDKPIDDAPVEVGGAAQFALGVNGIAMLALGFFPTLIMAYLHI